MRALSVFAFAAACSKPVVTPDPVGPTPSPDPKPTTPVAPTKPKDEIDSGAFITQVSGTSGMRETFSIRKLPTGNLVLAATTENLIEKESGGSGEIEVDAQFRPVRGRHRSNSAAEGKTYKLDGNPLTLEITRDDGRYPQKIVAKRPIEVYIQGPGMVAMTALCGVAGEVVLTTFSEDEPQGAYQEAYVGAAIGDLKRVVMNLSDYDFEIVCSGDKLIAGGIGDFNLWFVREGREADLTALQKAPRPTGHVWKSPQDETEKWTGGHTWLVDKKLFVTRDERRRMQRLTTFDVATGRELAHRDFKTRRGTYLDCVVVPGARLFCMGGEEKFLRLIDAKTLADVTDFAPVLDKAFPGVAPMGWMFDKIDGHLVDLMIDDARMARIDTKKSTAVATPMPKQRNIIRPDPARCEAVRSEGIKIGKEQWAIGFSPNGTTVKRTVGTKELPSFEIPLKHASLLACAPKGFAVYAVTYDETKSVVALVGTDGAIKWQLALEAHPDDNIRVSGNDLLIATYDQTRRVIAIDPKKGAIKWTATGPQPAK